MGGYLGHHSKASDCLPGGGQGGPEYVNYPPFWAACMHWGWTGCVPQTSERPEVASEVHVSGFRHGFDGFTCRKLIKASAELVTWQWLSDSNTRVLSHCVRGIQITAALPVGLLLILVFLIKRFLEGRASGCPQPPAQFPLRSRAYSWRMAGKLR